MCVGSLLSQAFYKNPEIKLFGIGAGYSIALALIILFQPIPTTILSITLPTVHNTESADERNQYDLTSCVHVH